MYEMLLGQSPFRGDDEDEKAGGGGAVEGVAGDEGSEDGVRQSSHE